MTTLNLLVNNFVADMQSSAVKTLELLGYSTDDAIKVVIESDNGVDLVADSVNNATYSI
jgi:hypothetical protein